MSGELHITSAEEVPPDPALARYIGLHHSLLSAVADIIDNALDARARHVLVEFQLDRRVPTGLRIIDDGIGMSDETLRNAVVMGRTRDYGDEDLGHFGVGLKAASLSQADELVILSHAAGYTPTGRSIRQSERPSGSPIVDTFFPQDVTIALDSTDPGFVFDHGTIIEWRRPRRLLSDPDGEAQAQWFDDTTSDLALGLGARYHRRLERDGIDLRIGSRDVPSRRSGIFKTVKAVNPFGYRRSGVEGFPKRFHGDLDGRTITYEAHIWPSDEQSSSAFLLTHRGNDRGQGFFIYRHDRLLQLGGWNRLVAASEELRFARISLDLDGVASDHANINPEKSGVEFDASLIEGIRTARAQDGTSFEQFLKTSRGAARDSHRRSPRPVEIPAAMGIPVAVMDSVRANAEVHDDEPPITVKWHHLLDGEFFRIGLESRELVLNARFHSALTGRDFASGTSAPLVRTLMYLLTADFFDGEFIGSAQRRRLKVLQEALWQAALAEESRLVTRNRSLNRSEGSSNE